MKLFHHLLAGSIDVVVLVATSFPVAAQAVDIPYLRSERVKDAVTGPELVVDESDDSSEFFSGSTESEDGSSELFDSIDNGDDDDSNEEADDSDSRRLAAITTARTSIHSTTKASPTPNNSTDTLTPTTTRPANTTALCESPKPSNVTSHQATALPRAPKVSPTMTLKLS